MTSRAEKVEGREMELKPKPCRKCGGENLILERNTYLLSEHLGGIRIECADCGERGPYKSTPRGAVKAWDWLVQDNGWNARADDWISLEHKQPARGQVCHVGWAVTPDEGYWRDKIGTWNGYEFAPDRVPHCTCNVELLTEVTHWKPLPLPSWVLEAAE